MRALLLIVIAILAACGQKGPLFLPERQGAAIAAPPAPATRPAASMTGEQKSGTVDDEEERQ